MRKLALLLLVSALPAFAGTFENVIVRDGDHFYIHGSTDRREVDDLGERYAYFERDGVAYAIVDAGTLRRIQKAMEPQVALGREQARVGEKQAAVGRRQAALGRKQADLGREQAHARGEHARELARRQNELTEQQRALAAEQRPLGNEQRELGARQREAARVATAQMERIFEDAIRAGTATRR